MRWRWRERNIQHVSQSRARAHACVSPWTHTRMHGRTHGARHCTAQGLLHCAHGATARTSSCSSLSSAMIASINAAGSWNGTSHADERACVCMCAMWAKAKTKSVVRVRARARESALGDCWCAPTKPRVVATVTRRGIDIVPCQGLRQPPLRSQLPPALEQDCGTAPAHRLPPW
jgi:hypothetical protein